MRYARKLVLLAVMAMAAMALAASPASAGPVEVEDDATGNHCTTVTVTNHVASGGCAVHVVNNGLIDLVRHIPGMGEAVQQSCDNEYDLNIGESGEGWITNVSITGADPTCGVTTTPCAEAGGAQEPWHLHISHSGGNEFAVARICLDIVTSPTTSCELEGNVAIEIINTGGELSAEAENSGSGVPMTARNLRGAHGGIPAANCIGLGAQIEIEGHWDFEGNPIHINHL